MFCRAITKLGFSKWRRQGGGALYSTSIATTKYLLVPWQIAAKECMSSLQVTISLSLTQLSYLEVSFARSMLVYSSFLSNRHTPPAYVRPELAFHFFIITVTWSEVPDYVCYNDKFTMYPFPVIKKLWNKYFGSTVQRVFSKEKYISKKNYL